MNAPAPSKAPSKAPSTAYLNFSRNTARALSVGALGSLSLWFALKFLLTEEPGPQQAVLQIAAGVLSLAGMVASVLLLAYIVAEVLEKAFGWVPTRGVVANFLTLLIFAALTLPAAILAWWDAGDEG